LEQSITFNGNSANIYNHAIDESPISHAFHPKKG